MNANEIYQNSSYTYYKLETPFGVLWLNPTSDSHIYADANHNSLGNGQVRPEGDRCAPLLVNRVEYSTSVHFYKWSDDAWHIGAEFNNKGETLNDYDRRQALHMSKTHSKGYNDSHPSFSAKDKLMAGLIEPINQWAKTHGDLLISAQAQDLQNKIERVQEEIAETTAKMQQQMTRLEELKASLTELQQQAAA